MSNDSNFDMSEPDNAAELSLEAILAEYKDFTPGGNHSPPEKDRIKKRSREIVIEALDHTIGVSKISSVDELLAESGKELEADAANTISGEKTAEDLPANGPAPNLSPEIKPTETNRPREEANSTMSDAEPEDYDSGISRLQAPIKNSVISPLVSLLALFTVRKQQKKTAEEASVESDNTEDEAHDPKPEKAFKFYARQIQPLNMRSFIAAGLCLLLMYISYGLPLAGAMRGNIAVISLMCVLIELSVIMAGLDVFTNGMVLLRHGRPGADSLVFVSCMLSLIDACVIAVTGKGETGLPFCAVSSLSVLFAMLGTKYTCAGYRATFQSLAVSKQPYVLTSERGIDEKGGVLLKSGISTEGFVNRSEAADHCEESFRLFAPFFLLASVILSVAASLVLGRSSDFIHIFSAVTAVSASFSAFLAFSLPFSVISRRLTGSGAAIAGYAGICEIGRSRRIIVTDGDIFPFGTVSLDGVKILEGAYNEKVISYTASVLTASGVGTAHLFSDLVSRNGIEMYPVDNFSVHEGGGVKAEILGESIYVGNNGFMNLMGIRLSQKQAAKNAVFTAISGVLVGVFTVDYTPSASIQDALATLLRSAEYPIFAVRDFNLTPLLIRQKYKMSTDGFDFPSFADRYRLSSTVPDKTSKVAAVISREGLGPMISATDLGKKAYGAVKILTNLSLIGSVLGMACMFFLCVTDSFDAASVKNMMTFMLFWLAPVIVVSFGLSR